MSNEQINPPISSVLLNANGIAYISPFLDHHHHQHNRFSNPTLMMPLSVSIDAPTTTVSDQSNRPATAPQSNAMFAHNHGHFVSAVNSHIPVQRISPYATATPISSSASWAFSPDPLPNRPHHTNRQATLRTQPVAPQATQHLPTSGSMFPQPFPQQLPINTQLFRSRIPAQPQPQPRPARIASYTVHHRPNRNQPPPSINHDVRPVIAPTSNLVELPYDPTLIAPSNPFILMPRVQMVTTTGQQIIPGISPLARHQHNRLFPFPRILTGLPYLIDSTPSANMTHAYSLHPNLVGAYTLDNAEANTSIRQGLDPERMTRSTLEYKYKKKDSESAHEKCSICLSEYREDVRVRRLPCLHLFHVKCVDIWLSKNANCPYCRFSFE